MRALTGLATWLVAFGLPAVAAAQATPQWSSGFEQGFPGEWLDYDGGQYTASGVPNSGFNEAWTIVDASDPLVFAGSHAYKGWPIAAQTDSHRAYPVLHSDIPTPLVNSFLVYLDLDYSQLDDTEWVHFATWGNNPDWQVHTMSVRARRLEMAHLDWSYIGPTPQPEFPLRRWVRFTAYLHYQGATGYVRVWQDGVPMLEGTYTTVSGTNLMRSHWGWYSSGSVDQGVQYNDEIQIWTLSAPLADLVPEPASPYGNPGGAGGTGGVVSTGGGPPSTAGTAGTAGGGSGGGSEEACACRAAGSGRMPGRGAGLAAALGLVLVRRARRRRR
jgi:hypothetical protein